MPLDVTSLRTKNT